MATKFGYMRVSTDEQNLDLQWRALIDAGVPRRCLFQDQASGGKRDREGLAELLEAIGEGDVLVVWRLDRLARSLAHLIEIVELLQKRGAGLISLNESIDTTTAGGRLIFHIFGALAEFERSLISDRTKAGMAAARARGAKIGRPVEADTAKIRELSASGMTRLEVAERLGVSEMTVYRHLKRGRA